MIKRRQFLQSSAFVFSFNIAGSLLNLSCAQASALKAPHLNFTEEQTADLGRLADALVIGAQESGITHFIDQQLQRDGKSDCLLMIRYLGVPAPYKEFYLAGLSAAQVAATHKYNKPIAQLDDAEIESFISAMTNDALKGWQGPPASFFYFVLRADAIDVRYGTEKGFRDLNLPYMAHITPKTAW